MFQNPKEKFEEREMVILENGGQKIYGVLHKPLVTNEKFPAVLMCHGFAGNKIGKYRIYVLLAERLAKAGIASLRIDFRGSGESEGSFSDMTVETEVSDAVRGLEFLRNNSLVDSAKIGILGNSFGGAIAVIAAQQAGCVKSIALLSPLFNSAHWRQKWELAMKLSTDEHAKKEVSRMLDGNAPGAAFYGSFFKMDVEKQLRDLSNIPLIHISSCKDERIGVDQAENYRRCRKGAVAETKFITLEQCDHDFSHPEERKMIIEEAAAWFSKTLKGS